MGKAKKKTEQAEQAPEKEQEDLLAQLQRLQAEFDNYKRRSEKDRENAQKYACGDVIASLLPIIDNYELALSNAKQKDSFYQGMELIYAQLKELLSYHGVTEINTKGIFDPAKHESMLAEDGKEKGMILEVLQKGYEQEGRVLRTAKVKVTR
ncbi:nucleotide exchange factor GrpE [Candidatus Woesearchaeota archaeon]|nr:nucleotide exchange factor GrpE [Candidatus Woesearchaeota archaeon]